MFRACDVADNAGWHGLEEASPRRFDGMANGEELGFLRKGTRDRLAKNRAMTNGPTG